MHLCHTPLRRFRALAVGSLAGLMAISFNPASAHAAHDNKIDQLIAVMSIDEKISMLRGGFPGVNGPVDPSSNGEVGYLPGIPRLGIPPLRFTDGPAGVRITPPTTALPAPVSLAASFSTHFARQYGKVLGHDAQATNNDVIFAPMINIVRVPHAGRNFETLGEDPFLMSQLAVAETRAIQREGTIATPKHFAENNQETNRQGINVHVDERTLNEIELPAFEATVKAGAGSVMCAYNKVNDLYSCENPTLLTDILRKRWGFDGFVVSDYGANQSVVPALTAGMGVEFLAYNFGWTKGCSHLGTALNPCTRSGGARHTHLDGAFRAAQRRLADGWDGHSAAASGTGRGGRRQNRQGCRRRRCGATEERRCTPALPQRPALARRHRAYRAAIAGRRRRQLAGEWLRRTGKEPIGRVDRARWAGGQHQLRGRQRSGRHRSALVSAAGGGAQGLLRTNKSRGRPDRPASQFHRRQRAAGGLRHDLDGNGHSCHGRRV
jgi:hypothetical protein